MSITHDLEFNWLTENYGDGWKIWRDIAAKWLGSFDHAIDHRRAAMVRFIEGYLIPNFISTPQQLFFNSNPDYKKYMGSTGLSDQTQVRQINEIANFTTWIIETEYSEENDNGALLPIVGNPISKEKIKIYHSETVYNPLPYSYIQDLRKILCPKPDGYFSDWKWAKEVFEGQRNYRTDWYYVDESLIDANDPDCVWRTVEIKKNFTISLNRKIRTYKAGEKAYQLWSPVRSMVIFIKLQLPLRTYQVRMLDSGEADTWRFEQGRWILNKKHDFALGKESNTWKKGVFRRINVPEIGEMMTGMYINTNKTADRNKDELDRGYTIPWEHKTVLYWLEKLRDWQERYNPISEPTSAHSLRSTHFGATKTKVQRDALGDICFLFRDPSERSLQDKIKPIRTQPVTILWYQLLKKLENIKFETGETLKNNKKIKLVYPDGHRTYFPLHCIRVSLITCYAMEGDVPAPVLSKLLVGHSRLIMTLYYTKITPSVMAKKMAEAEDKIIEKNDSSLTDFLEDSELRQIEVESVYNSFDSIASALKTKSPAGWQERNIGLCLMGGNTSRSDENPELGGCWNGGELTRVATNTSKNSYSAVPHGHENCIRCRWYITDASYLNALRAHFNNLSYQASLSAKLAGELETQKDKLLDERYFCEEQNRYFSEQNELKSLERRWEKQVSEADDYCKDMIACFQTIKKIITIEESRDNDDHSQKMVSFGSIEDIKESIQFYDTDSELWQLLQVCEDAELYPDLSEELKRTPAILNRSNKLNYLLMHNGYAPVFMNMDEKMQLLAGNAMIRAMAKSYKDTSKTNGFYETSNYIEAQNYLEDKGILDKGLTQLSEIMNSPITRLSDLAHNDAVRVSYD